jgi:hypothetical protein
MPRTETQKPLAKRTRLARRARKLPAAKGPLELCPDVPHWLATDSRWQDLPQEIREAVPKLIAPAYRRFVLDAPGELERSVGLTLVHLMWLEICDQSRMAIAAANPSGLEAILNDPDAMIDKHLRLATVKCQTAELLLKLRVVNEALQRPQPTRNALPPPIDLPIITAPIQQISENQ